MMPMLLIGLVALVAVAAAIAGTFSDGPLAGKAGLLAGWARHAAVFLVVMGLLSQAVGLYQALSAIEGAGGQVPPAMVAGGLKVSFIAPIFGLMEFLVLYTLSFIVRMRTRD